MRGEPEQRVVRAMVALGHRAPAAVLSVALVLVATGVWLGTRLTFDTDVLNLVPRHDPVVQDLKRVLNEFGSLETLLVAVPIKGDEQLDTAFALVDALQAQLALSPNLADVQSRLEDPVKLAEAVLRHAVLFLDEDGLRALENRLTPEGLAARAADIRAALDAPHGLLAKEFDVRDPLGFLPLLLGRVSRTPASLKVDFASGYFLSADHSFVLLLAKPVRPAQDIDFDHVLFADLDARVAAARAGVAKELEIDPGQVPEVLLGGGHRIALEDATLIRGDIVTNSMSSLVCVMLLFFLAYRRFATAHYAFLPLASGLALTFGFAYLALGRLSSATAGFAALLVGLGIDFTIVLYGRYLEERRRGAEIGPALDAMAAHAGPAILLGMITTVGTFYAFLPTRFSGLQEFGLLTGTGIVLMALSAFLLVPALVTVFDRGKPPAARAGFLNLLPLMRWAAARRRAVLWAVAIVTAASIIALPRLKFDDDVRNLRSPSNRGVTIQERVAAAFGLSFNAMMIRVEAESVPAALARVRELDRELHGLVKAGIISSYESLASLVPPPEAQRRALAWVEAHRELTDPARVRRLFNAELAAHGLVAEGFAPGMAMLDEMLRPARPVSLDVWRDTPLQQVVERSLRQSGGRVVTVVNVFSPAGMWRREAPAQLVDAVASVEGASLTGVNVVSQRLRETVWQDAALAGSLGLVLVVAVLLVRRRWLSHSLLCLLPMTLGILWTLGLMVVFDLHLNLLNAFVIAMVIGVGSDYGIYMSKRIREGDDLAQHAETAVSVLLAAATTIVGFGSLVTTHYPGLQSIGWMTAMGVALSCFGAIVVLPLLARPAGR